MYLSIKQHDQFRNILMGFEIPYRSYIASILLANYPSNAQFENAIMAKKASLQPSDPLFLREILPKEATSSKIQKMYTRFTTAASSAGIVPVDQDIPMVGGLNIITFSLTGEFQDLYNLFSGYALFCELAEKYRYARNKLDHPGCRTLEDSHLIPVLSFVKDICTFLDDSHFVQKSKVEILAEVSSLQQNRLIIPIKKHNLYETPYVESQVVCRDIEIVDLKTYIYGNPGDLRKRHSYCIYGYEGVGKTALVVEVAKQIIQDVIDGTTVNDYKPEYIFFFSAKKRQMKIAEATGRVISQQVKWHFETAEELITLIFESLNVATLRGFHAEGIIIVDNLETLSTEEREKVKIFVETQTPPEMQFILTSRNSEEYESNKKLSGFEEESGRNFISRYIDENVLDIELTESEANELLNISKGNTLVLVLCIRRLSQKLVNISGLQADFSSPNAWKKIRNSLSIVAPNAYESISEFMFKDTFEQLELIFAYDIELFNKVLKIFAIISNEGIDLSTVCLLTKCSYPKVESAVDALCNYLILERKGSGYFINQFAEKYIIGRFIPDAEVFQTLSAEIVGRQRQIRESLENLKQDMIERPDLSKIMRDWQIVTDSDQITAAKMYDLYGRANRECNRGSKFKVEAVFEEFITETKEAEEITAHPFVKYQKARILQLIDKSNVLSNKHIAEIQAAYNDAIYVIKTVDQYASIQTTKSYASLLWLYGQFLGENGNLQYAIRYLEDGKESFEAQNIIEQQYYQCVTLLGTKYLEFYLLDRSRNIGYLRRARSISRFLQSNYTNLGKATKYARTLKRELQKYGSF